MPVLNLLRCCVSTACANAGAANGRKPTHCRDESRSSHPPLGASATYRESAEESSASHSVEVRSMRKKYPGNYPMGLRHGSRGAELEGGMDPFDQLNKLSDEEEKQGSAQRAQI
eukprot:2603464-Pyramimonas_sp.AAC.1